MVHVFVRRYFCLAHGYMCRFRPLHIYSAYFCLLYLSALQVFIFLLWRLLGSRSAKRSAVQGEVVWHHNQMHSYTTHHIYHIYITLFTIIQKNIHGSRVSFLGDSIFQVTPPRTSSPVFGDFSMATSRFALYKRIWPCALTVLISAVFLFRAHFYASQIIHISSSETAWFDFERSDANPAHGKTWILPFWRKRSPVADPRSREQSNSLWNSQIPQNPKGMYHQWCHPRNGEGLFWVIVTWVPSSRWGKKWIFSFTRNVSQVFVL